MSNVWKTKKCATNFKFKVKIDSIKKNDLSLNYDNIDYVREALMNIFHKAKSSFKKEMDRLTFS